LKAIKNKALVKSTIDLSQTFKYKVITEGVETKEQMKEVTNLGCNIIQGYYYSKPLSNKAFERYIKEGVLK
jgi:EAL domain-containing protein (putative c-di-GMP-specific phosphodiesterase class I)